jgi:hypothetical protein
MALPASQQSTVHADSHGAASARPMRIALLLFLFLNCVYLLTSTGRARSIDEVDPVLQSESLLLRHSTAIPQAVGSGIYFGKVDLHGLPRSAWPAGHALLVMPWSAFGHYVLARQPGIPRSISDLAFASATCWSSATYAALAVAASFLLFFKVGNTLRSALAGSLLLGFCTPLFVYSGWLFSEPASTALFALAALLLFASGKEIPVSRAVLASLLLGFSIHVRPANMVTVLVFIAATALLKRPEQKRGFAYSTTVILVVVVGISGALYLARNYALFGNPLDFGVPATAENAKDLDSWRNPFWTGIFGFLFSPGKSVFLFSPPIIVGILGLPCLWRRNRGLALLAGAAPVANLILYSFRTQWEGSYCYGPRYLLPSLTLLCYPIAALLRERSRGARPWLRPLLWITAIGGLLVQGIGLATNILEDMVRNRYYIGNWDYRMSYSPITGQLQLIWKYLHVEPTAVGLGWDRWFVLLRAAGATPSLLTGITSLMLAGALIFGLLTWRSVRNES